MFNWNRGISWDVASFYSSHLKLLRHAASIHTETMNPRDSGNLSRIPILGLRYFRSQVVDPMAFWSYGLPEIFWHQIHSCSYVFICIFLHIYTLQSILFIAYISSWKANKTSTQHPRTHEPAMLQSATRWSWVSWDNQHMHILTSYECSLYWHLPKTDKSEASYSWRSPLEIHDKILE